MGEKISKPYPVFQILKAFREQIQRGSKVPRRENEPLDGEGQYTPPSSLNTGSASIVSEVQGHGIRVFGEFWP